MSRFPEAKKKKKWFFSLRRSYSCRKHCIWIQISAIDTDSLPSCALFSAFSTGHGFQRSAVSLDGLHQQQHGDKSLPVVTKGRPLGGAQDLDEFISRLSLGCWFNVV